MINHKFINQKPYLKAEKAKKKKKKRVLDNLNCHLECQKSVLQVEYPAALPNGHGPEHGLKAKVGHHV
jgi:hypothetical protein